ncbi:MAG: hypothetical protein Q9224_000035 [Gallowayella concinna]
MVVPQTQSVAPTVKPTSQPVNTSTKPPAKLTMTPVASTLEPSPNRPASLQGAQQAFEDIRFDYDIFTKRTGFAGFWKKVYPARARCLLAYTVEAFATLGCKLSSMRTGQRLPPVQSLSKHDMLMRQLEEVLKDASLVKSDGVGLIRPDVPVDPTRSETFFTYIVNAFPHHADEHRLLHVIASKLAECLTGTADPLWRSFSEARRTKRFWKMSITKLLASFFQRAYKTNQEGGIFHILELGGGTGGTTKYIVDFLEKLGIRFTYTFTDLAGSLVTAANKRFAGKDFMEFNVVDIEKQPRMESLNKYHTIISTNCIHATRNLQISGNNIRQMLRPDGFVSLVEFTRNIFWFDLVFGLLEGWWLFEDGREHVLASETFWDRSLRDSGFKHVTWTDGRWEEARTLRIITAFAAEPEHEAFKPKPKTVSRKMEVETVTYRRAGNTPLYADIYMPPDITPGKKRPIALLIHGGGHVMFTRKEVNLKQIQLLHAAGSLPVSVDYRFVPELNIIDGPMNDVCEALGWARFQLPELAPTLALGWSTGGTLAMTLAYTTAQRRLRAPEAILAFYCPTHYEDDWWKCPIYPEASVSSPNEDYDHLEGVQEEPVSTIHLLSIPAAFPQDPDAAPPSSSAVASISPLAQFRRGTYRTPTFLIHGRPDDMIPWEQSQRTVDALQAKGIEGQLEIVEGARHLFDTFPERGVEFDGQVRKGYEWLGEKVRGGK